MEFKNLSSSTLLFFLLIPCWMLASIDNPSQPLIRRGNRVSPMPLPAVYSMDPRKNQIFGIKEMRRTILEFLTYREFGALNGVSSSWHSIMKEGLSDKKNPLILPTDRKLVAYIHRCFDRIPKPGENSSGPGLSLTDGLNREQPADSADTEARLAVVNNLIKLCNRSYYPGATLMNAFRQYDRLVPEDEKLLIFNPYHEIRLSDPVRDLIDILRQLRHIEHEEMKDAKHNEKKDDQKLDHEQSAALDANPENSVQDETEPSRNEFDSRDIPDLITRAYLRATGAPIEEQSKQELQQKLKSIKQELLPLFIRWQPFGVLLKLAQLYKADTLGADMKFNWLTKNPINLLMAPELSDIEMIASGDKNCFIQSEKCYQQSVTTEVPRITNLIKRLNFLRKMHGLPYGAYEPLTRTPSRQLDHDLQLYLGFRTFNLADQVNEEQNPDAKNKLLHELIQTLLQLDQVTDGEFAIREILLDPTTAWNAERLGGRTAPVNELYKCFEALVLTGASGSYRFDVPAAFCDRIAWLSNDPVIQEKFLKKSVFFWDKCLKNISNNGMLNRVNLIRDGMLTYYRASQGVTDPRERALYYRTAVKLKWLAALGGLLGPNIYWCCPR